MAERTVADQLALEDLLGHRLAGRLGIAPPALTAAIRKVHDFLTVGAAAPLQAAGTVALGLPDPYYAALLAGYRERRAILVAALEAAGFGVSRPAGAYYVMTDIGRLARPGEDDTAFCRRLVADPGVAAVPGSSFYSDPALGHTRVRFAFPKQRATLDAAAARLALLEARSA